MTPKEKARELVDKFYQTTPNETWINEPLGEFMETYTAWGQAKQCALITVDELIKIHYLLTNTQDTSPSINYWKEVKQEIEKL
jgi:hypothetical protein